MSIAAIATASFLATGGAGAAYLSPHLWRSAQQHQLQRRCTAKRAIVLTFDDGPGKVLTPKLLACLAAQNAPATFFTLARQVRFHSDIVHHAVAAGHDIGLHGDRHLHAWKSLPAASIHDMQNAFEVLVAAGHRPTWYRPPYGKTTLPLWLATRRLGLHTLWWTHVSGDTWDNLPERTRLLDQLRRDQGGVVLLHDFDDRREPQNEKFALEMTEDILRMAPKEGFTIVKTCDLFKK